MEAVNCGSKVGLVAKRVVRSQHVLAGTQRELQAQRTREQEAEALLGQTLEVQVRILTLILLNATSGKVRYACLPGKGAASRPRSPAAKGKTALCHIHTGNKGEQQQCIRPHIVV